MPPLWVDASLGHLELSPAAIRCWALVGALVNLAFVGLVLFCS